MLPRLGSSKLVSTWILVTLVASVIALVDDGWMWGTFGLDPMAVWRGQVWRLGTWIFVEPTAISLFVALLTIFRFGSELADGWGDRALRRYATVVLVGAAVATVVVAIVLDGARLLYGSGGWAVGDVLMIAWARRYPEREIVLYQMVTVRGSQVVLAVVGLTVLMALGDGVLAWTPELLACGAALLYPVRASRFN